MLDRFGENSETWNVQGDWRGEGDCSGLPGIGLFGSALQVWSSLQDRAVTVGEAAMAFNALGKISGCGRMIAF